METKSNFPHPKHKFLNAANCCLSQNADYFNLLWMVHNYEVLKLTFVQMELDLLKVSPLESPAWLSYLNFEVQLNFLEI